MLERTGTEQHINTYTTNTYKWAIEEVATFTHREVNYAEFVGARVVVVHGQDEIFREGEHDWQDIHVVHQLECSKRGRGSNHLVQLAPYPLAAHLCGKTRQERGAYCGGAGYY